MKQNLWGFFFMTDKIIQVYTCFKAEFAINYIKSILDKNRYEIIMKSKLVIYILVVILITSCFGTRMRVKPPTILLQEAPVGETYGFDLRRGQQITIGPMPSDRFFKLNVEPASVGGSNATGYVDFPEPAWFQLEKDSVFVPANTEEKVKMWLDIPEDEGFYNHHWLLGIALNPISGPGARQQIQVGAYLLYRIETEAKADVVPTCAEGEIVSAPSMVIFDDVKPGEEVTKVARLFCGNQKSQLASVYPLDPTSPVAQLTILGTPGFPRLQNPEWLDYPEEVVIPGVDEPGSPFPITVKIPRGEQIRHFEEILMIESENCRPAFIRILVNTKVN